MSGYAGYSKSNNAIAAEESGMLPLTRATRAVACQAGCTQKVARAALLAIGSSEWHHTSKHFNPTDYYDVDQAVEGIGATEISNHITYASESWRDQIDAAIRAGGVSMDDRHANIQTVATAISAACENISPEEVIAAYYYHLEVIADLV